MVLAMGTSGLANAGPGKGKGPRQSVDVFNLCSIEDRDFLVSTTVTEASGDDPDTVAEVASYTVAAFARLRGRSITPIGTQMLGEVPDQVMFSLCNADGTPIDALDGARAVNANVTVVLGDGRTFTSQCDDDPATELDESDLNLDAFACSVP
jgi:hypothetical protein